MRIVQARKAFLGGGQSEALNETSRKVPNRVPNQPNTVRCMEGEVLPERLSLT